MRKLLGILLSVFLLAVFSACPVDEGGNNPGGTISVTGVDITETSVSIDQTMTSQLHAQVLPADASNQNVTWTSDNENIATITDGLVTAVGDGSTVITVTTDDGGYTADCSITVGTTSIYFCDEFDNDVDEKDISLGGNGIGFVRLGFDPIDADEMEIDIDISNETFVTVDSIAEESSGFIIIYLNAISEGSAVLTASSALNPVISDSITVNVISDTTAPTLFSAMKKSSTSISLEMSETMASTGLTDTGNYTVVSDPDGSAVTLGIESVSSSEYMNATFITLVMSDTLPLGEVEIIAENITDLAGNAIDPLAKSIRLNIAPEHGCTIDTDYVNITAGVVTFDSGAVAVSGFPWINNEFVVLIFNMGTEVILENAIGFGQLNADGSLTQFYDTNYDPLVLSSGDYDFNVIGIYDCDGDAGTDGDREGVYGESVTITVP